MLARIILPKFDNDGVSLEAENKTVLVGIASDFGGFTLTEGRGAWVDNGKLYYDESLIVDIAYNGDNPTEFVQNVRDVAEEVKTSHRQQAVYVHFCEADIRFI